MNKIALALLCACSLFTLTLLNVNPALADKLSLQHFTNSTLQATNTEIVNAPIFREIQFNEKVKLSALHQSGCGCASCQVAARQMLLQGRLL